MGAESLSMEPEKSVVDKATEQQINSDIEGMQLASINDVLKILKSDKLGLLTEEHFSKIADYNSINGGIDLAGEIFFNNLLYGRTYIVRILKLARVINKDFLISKLEKGVENNEQRAVELKNSIGSSDKENKKTVEPSTPTPPETKKSPDLKNPDPRFINFTNYKELGGEMSQEDFIDVQRQPEDLMIGLKEVGAMGVGLPTTEIALIFSKIRAKFPDENPDWIIIETYLCLGKK